MTQYGFNVRQKVSQTASSAGGASAEHADFSEFGFTKLLDKTSPLLAMACAAGTHFDTIVVELCRAGGDKVRFTRYTFSALCALTAKPEFGFDAGAGMVKIEAPIAAVTVALAGAIAAW